MPYNQKLNRVTLDYHRLASASDVQRLKGVVCSEMARHRATRGLIRVLTDNLPAHDLHFEQEACIHTGKGFLLYLALNARNRFTDEEQVKKETEFAVDIITAPRNPQKGFDIVRLDAERETALEVSRLLSDTYSSYPVPLDIDSVSGALREHIPYAVIEDGKIVSALFGAHARFAELDTVEFTLMCTKSALRGIDMTTALAERIRLEAMERFGQPLMLAETIAGPVMRSCHDLGMELRGLLREHYRIGIKDRVYTNFYLWSL